jgi:hypothetical protein
MYLFIEMISLFDHLLMVPMVAYMEHNMHEMLPSAHAANLCIKQ